MLKLSLTTLLWAFSFSLIGAYLAGKVDPYFSALLRIALSALLFAPLILRTKVGAKRAFALMGIGAIQLGIMYVAYYQSFELISVPEVLVFTILTPIYVSLSNDIIRREFSLRTLLSALLAVLGAGVIRWGTISKDFIAGFLLIQVCNICFALGQILYRRLGKQQLHREISEFGYFFFGALVVVIPAYLLFGKPVEINEITLTQWIVLLWLGLGASGLGYFLWNQGAREVDTGALAIMNNALIPAGLIVNLLIWDQSTDLLKLMIGLTIIGLSLLINGKLRTNKSSLSIKK
jgi:carboxylate/amino acid/amine transporter